MKPIKKVFLAALVLGLAACSNPSDPSVTRNGPLDVGLLATSPQADFNVADVRIIVPNALVVSEANVYYPNADIVWRGDAYGNRHQQIKSIFETAMTRGVQGLNGAQAISVDIEVKRFHSLTQRARYTTGGMHSIKFVMTLRDQASGALIADPQLISADLKAYGGRKAIASEHRGQTQKVRITAHLAGLIQTEISRLQASGLVANLPARAPE